MILADQTSANVPSIRLGIIFSFLGGAKQGVENAHTSDGPPKKPAKKRHTARAANECEKEPPTTKRQKIGRVTRYTA